MYKVLLAPHMWLVLAVNYLVGQGGLLNEFLQMKN